jgi:hypothetical protein
MGRKGEEEGRWAGRGPPGEAGSRPGDGTSWLDPGAGRLLGRPDPFTKRRPLGPKGYHRPDDRIRDDVCERIARSGIDAREVEVAVEAGEVTLTGTVESREDKRTLEDVADDVYGVEDVHNRLRLQRSRSTRAPDVAARGPSTAAPRARGRRRRTH